MWYLKLPLFDYTLPQQIRDGLQQHTVNIQRKLYDFEEWYKNFSILSFHSIPGELKDNKQ